MSTSQRGGSPADASRGTSEDGPLGRLRTLALIALAAAAVASVASTLYVGRHNEYRLVTALIAIWALSPFALLLLAHVVSKRWPALTRRALYGVMLVLALVSLAVYGVAATLPPGARTTPIFVVVAPVSWLLIVLVLGIAALVSRGRPQGRGGA